MSEYKTIPDDVLIHHGIKGMHWGIRRYQNPDGTLTESGRKRYYGDGKEIGEARKLSINDRKYESYQVTNKMGSNIRQKTKYTNIDGSLNEKGKMHAQEYINKQVNKNNEYYEKQIKKYEKKAEKYKDNPELKKKFLDMKEDAIRTRDNVNKNINKFGIDEIMTKEHQDKLKVLKTAGTIAGTSLGIAAGVGALGAGINAINYITGNQGKFADAFKNFNPQMAVDKAMELSNTPAGRRAEEVIEGTIRTYADVRAYALGIALDESMTRLNQMGVPQKVGKTVGAGVNSALNTSGISPELINSMSGLVNAAGSNANTILSNPAAVSSINSMINTSASSANALLSNPSTASTVNSIINNGTRAGGNMLGSLSGADVTNLAYTQNEINKILGH